MAPESFRVFRPSKEQFDRPFVDYVSDVFKKYPDLPAFKVVPPKGWAPRARGYDDLSKVAVATPIRQHVFGRSGAYTAVLEEQPPMSVGQLRAAAAAPGAAPPPAAGRRGAGGAAALERAFWSSLTQRPPLYGADTPGSLFDARLPSGWNLRALGCMLCAHPRVPHIPGVTSPALYAGAYRSFFAWHCEDMDLLSVNYLHVGAPKVWYAVPPSARRRFAAAAASLLPGRAAECGQFLRHKDVMIAPATLRRACVPVHTGVQRPGEFVVLNAGAFHAGFNAGFNVAEAVNFATPAWVPLGREAEVCECGALADAVGLDMRLFCPDMTSSEEESSSSEEDSSSDDDSSSSSDDGPSSSDDDEGATAGTPARGRQQQQQRGLPARKPRTPAAGAKRAAAAPPARGLGGPAAKRPRASPARPAPGAGAPPPAAVVLGAHPAWGPVAATAPVALVERLHGGRAAAFSLVVPLARAATGADAGGTWVGVLEESAAEPGLFCPTPATRCVRLGRGAGVLPRLVTVRATWCGRGGGRKRGGWALQSRVPGC